MKRLSLLLVMIFMLGMVASVLNATEVTIGAGDQQARKPVDMYWMNSLFECMYFQDELGFVSGSISGVKFYNNFTTDLPNMPTNIWLGTTTQTSFAANGWIPSGQLTQVFNGVINYPMGANTIDITFTAPFNYTGGTLVMMVERPMDVDYYSSSDYFLNQTIGTNRALNLSSDSTDFDPAAPPATGATLSGQFPKTTFVYTGQSINNDLGALSVTGNTTPSAGTISNYVVTIRNNGAVAQSTYQVKLMREGNVEIASVAGTPIQPQTTATFTLPWTPATAGATYLFGKVVLTGDQIPANDISPNLNVTVQPAGVQAVTIGAGDEQARLPMDFFWKNSLYECLYYSDELGFASGTITSLQLYNNFTTDNPNGATKIWLGSTNVQDLSGGWIPSTQLTLVYDGVLSFPAGANTITIPLTTPYMHTPGNLVMMVNRPMDGQWYSSTDYFQCQTGTQMRALNLYSDSTTFDPTAPAAATAMAQFPKITIMYSGQAIVNDMGCLSISGNTTPSVGTATDYVITVKNNGTAVQNNYQVKLFKEGDIEVGSVNGTTINSLETLQFSVPWTPAATGPTFLYGKVVLANDEIAQNNQTANYPVVVQQAGIVAVTVGTGGSTGRMPLNMFYRNSLFETVYLSSELNIGGLLTAIQFYNSFSTNLPAMPTNIWVGETTQNDLSGGWIPSTQLTQVFTGTVDYPSGQNNILVTLTTPYPYGGGNLVVMVERPMDTQYYSSSDLFVTQTGTVASRTRNAYSDGTDYDPAAPPTITPIAMFPKTTFMFITDGLGSVNGTVYHGTTPLSGATVTVAGTPLTYTTTATGTYNFPYVSEGAQQVSATKHGFNVVTNTVTVVEDQAVTSNFTLTQLAQVTVTGRIVGSDNPTVGLSGATITLSGYEPYSATTDASGQFTINNVYANQTYNYVVHFTGYADTSGEVVVGTTNVNMGDVIINEVAYPPNTVVATEATDYSNVVLTWNEPGTGVAAWIHYDSGENDDSIGTGGAADFDVAIRYPASALQDYLGTSLQALKVWPAQPGTFSLRVWTGGTPTAPGTMVVDQAFTPVLDTYNTVILDNPVPVNGNEELWFGYRCNVTSGYPAGCDAGPATDGFGNMMYFQGAWSTLLELAPSLNYNWNIQGYVGYGAPTQAAKLTPLPFNAERYNEGSLAATGIKKNISLARSNDDAERTDRVRLGYKVWRLLAANQGNEATWTLLTPTTITPLTYTDNTWAPQPSGVYKFAVKAVYTNDVLSTPAFSNEVHKGMMGTLSGTVTEFGTNVPIAGATITAGDYSGTSDATGNYSFGVYQGTYTVTCVKTGYQAGSQAGVSITGLQTTNLNFVLTEITLPPGAVQAVEASPSLVNVTWMEPGSGTDISEGFEGTAFPPTDWTQIINNTGAAGTTGVYPTWCQVGEVALTPAVPPHTGAYQAALWWDYAHQDEWLITPEFICPPAADLNFWTYVYLGSTNLDHYNVKVSTDGTTWTTLWDATALTGGWNYYDTPIAVDLDSYAGQEIKLAWQAVDGDGQGLWYVWFLDDIVVGNPTTTLRFPASSLTRVSAAGNDHRAPETVMPKRPISREMMHSSGLTSANKVANETVVRDDRVLNGYKVWRLLQGQENNESAWVQLTPDVITATAYQDTGWGPLPDGTYKWSVKAVYTGGALSPAAFSNAIPKITQIGTIAGIVRNMQNAPISGATVTCGAVTATTNAQGAYSMTIQQGTHSVTASHPSYSPSTQTGVVVITGQTTTVNFQLAPTTTLLDDGFESYADFATTFAPWTNVDVDQSATYTMTGTTWPGAGSAMAFMVFNPASTTPPATTVTPHAGAKMAVAIASTTPPNNDWLITPQVNNPVQLKFWARSLTAQYGLERFKVGVSTTGTAPDDFTIISGANYVQAPIEWTEYTYDLDAYNGNVYVGVQCLSNDAWFFMVDDFEIGGSDAEDPIVPVVATTLKNNFPNPFNPETTIAFSVKDNSPVTIGIYNVKGQLVKTLVNETKAAGNYTVPWNGTDSNGRAVSSGIYYYKMNAGKYSSTKKMIMMK